MTEDTITHDHRLAEGDVALVFKADGDIIITHNIAKVRATNMIDGETSAGFLMAIACTVAMGDTRIATTLINEAANRLDDLRFPEVPRTMN